MKGSKTFAGNLGTRQGMHLMKAYIGQRQPTCTSLILNIHIMVKTKEKQKKGKASLQAHFITDNIKMNSNIQETHIRHHSLYGEWESTKDWTTAQFSNCKLFLILTNHVH